NPAEAGPLFELLGDRLGHELRIQIGVLHFNHGDWADLALDEVFNLLAELVDFSALGPDDQTRPRGPQGDAHFLTGALDEDIANGREWRLAVELPIDELAKPKVLAKKFAVGLLGGIPARLPVFGDPDAKTQRINFLTHALPVSFPHAFAFSPRSSKVTTRSLIFF